MSTVSCLNRDKKLTVSIGILLCCLAAGVLPMRDCTSITHPSGFTPVRCLNPLTPVRARSRLGWPGYCWGEEGVRRPPAVPARVRGPLCLSHAWFDGRGEEAGCSSAGAREMEEAHQKGFPAPATSKTEREDGKPLLEQRGSPMSNLVNATFHIRDSCRSGCPNNIGSVWVTTSRTAWLCLQLTFALPGFISDTNRVC